jgi:anthranilate phosphoribosyltransferase
VLVPLVAAAIARGGVLGVALAREALAAGKALAKMHQFIARTKELVAT